MQPLFDGRCDQVIANAVPAGHALQASRGSCRLQLWRALSPFGCDSQNQNSHTSLQGVSYTTGRPCTRPSTTLARSTACAGDVRSVQSIPHCVNWEILAALGNGRYATPDALQQRSEAAGRVRSCLGQRMLRNRSRSCPRWTRTAACRRSRPSLPSNPAAACTSRDR